MKDIDKKKEREYCMNIRKKTQDRQILSLKESISHSKRIRKLYNENILTILL